MKKQLLNYAKQKNIHSGVIFLGKSGKPLDRSIWRQMKQLCKAAGVKEFKVFPHNLRKLFARTFYGIEKDIAKLVDILGHSSINTTRIYIMPPAQNTAARSNAWVWWFRQKEILHNQHNVMCFRYKGMKKAAPFGTANRGAPNLGAGK